MGVHLGEQPAAERAELVGLAGCRAVEEDAADGLFESSDAAVDGVAVGDKFSSGGRDGLLRAVPLSYVVTPHS